VLLIFYFVANQMFIFHAKIAKRNLRKDRKAFFIIPSPPEARQVVCLKPIMGVSSAYVFVLSMETNFLLL